MNQDWQHFLTQQGAVIEHGLVQHFTGLSAELDAAQNSTILCDVGQSGTLRVSGEDAQSFLQNLLSNDIREVTATRAQLSSFNTAKGRMLASMLVRRDGEDYLLQLPRSLCEPIRKKLSMYILRAKVKITDSSDEIVSLGLSGEKAQEILAGQSDSLPQQPFGTTTTAVASILMLGATRFQVSVPVQQAPALWQTFSQQARPVGSACWDWLDIRAGLPSVLPATQEQFVPQMLNFELIGGVNFKKGCYPGQEVVARMHYLGKPKRRMYLAHLDTQEAPHAGDELFSADTDEHASGMIANAAPAPGGGHDVLAVVQTASRETQAVHWKSRQGDVLAFLPLPYALPDA